MLVGLLETRVKENKASVCLNKIASGWKWANNYCTAANGRV